MEIAGNNKFTPMRKRCRVPEVLWRLFKHRPQTLAQTLLTLISPPTLQCRSDDDRISFLLTRDDPSDYRYLLNHCFVVVSDTAPPLPPPFDHRSRFSQTEIVRRTIEMMLYENRSTQNVICAGYNKHKRSGVVLEALTSSSWSLLLERIGDDLMVYLLKHTSIFVPLNKRKHQQVAGIAIDDLCWKHLKLISESKKQQPSSGVPESYHKAVSVAMDIDIPESFVSSHRDSTKDANLSRHTQENEVLPVSQSRKRLRSHACRRKRKRRNLSFLYMCETKSSLLERTMKSLCSCCSVWQTLQKVPPENQIKKRPMLYKSARTTSVLPEKHKINSLRPNVSGANALFKDIFGSSDLCLAVQSTQCSHSKDTCTNRTTKCLYHSLHKLLRILIRKAICCPRARILNKHILGQNSTEGVVSFIWAVCMNIIPRELLGNCRILRKNISKLIRLRIYEKISLHQCMYRLKLSSFKFLSDNNSPCNPSTKRKLLERWIYWMVASFVVPLLQANFYVTESEHAKLQVLFYEKSIWEKLTKTSIAHLKDECYSLVDVASVKEIINSRRFGFSKVRFRPKANGIRPLANLKSSSRMKFSVAVKEFKSVNVVLQDLHATLKDVKIKNPEKLGSSVFSYNEVHKNLRKFLSRVKNGCNTLPHVYMVVADVQKAYDSINQDKLLKVMKDVIVNDQLLHETHQAIASNQHFHVCQYNNLSRQFRSLVQNDSSHHIIVDQGRSRIALKDDLHFNLEQHVKYNLLLTHKLFYKQNVGISQGSILSSLLCSFYLGHMENTKLVPFLEKVTNKSDKSDFMLLRFVDDFLFISTSKDVAHGFISRLERGFGEYNCYMNQEKFGLSFNSEKIRLQSNRSCFGNKFLRWSGLFINCETLEVQADYTRYMYRLMKRRLYYLHADPVTRPILKVKRREVEWLGLTAYIQVLKRKQSRYSDLLRLLDLKLNLKFGDIESHDLKFAVDKSNSLILWKIKY
ncbi:hypothetical protein QVD17_05253 [Tagetes erecta]|uniref:Telomerase reverse transcriptase n=1 Tax=Tagetes erecta TaxID=13708 RepID=A0AAD8LL47_TARER|nr:hypothetical protein QVD17_05253 [Tagetes erecta]